VGLMAIPGMLAIEVPPGQIEVQPSLEWDEEAATRRGGNLIASRPCTDRHGVKP
jgi:hypothetical protein